MVVPNNENYRRNDANQNFIPRQPVDEMVCEYNNPMLSSTNRWVTELPKSSEEPSFNNNNTIRKHQMRNISQNQMQHIQQQNLLLATSRLEDNDFMKTEMKREPENNGY